MKTLISIILILFFSISHAAQIVLIDTGTIRVGINNIGDIVSIHDDDVELGPAYDTFKKITIQASDTPITAAELQSRLATLTDGSEVSKHRHKMELSEVQETELATGVWTKAQILAFIDNVEVNL